MANRLIDEQSPYLLQHAHNPVDWYPWGEEPFKRAKTENKPVLVSIGYAACHWCHVMERESFENEEVAAYMNEHFINIKVDREEHPAVDHMYMDAIQAISGSGGWPLNAFVTPDKVPFYGGTYYPPTPLYNRPSWIQLLQRMNEIWHKQPEEVATQTNQMLQYLQQASKAATAGQGTTWDKDTCKQMAENLLKQADKRHGGFGNAPKFPGTMAISFLLEHYHYTGNEEAEKHALHSLDAMIEGGIYDQAGGGFARYSTDAEWLAPHFEKMLYDNALLVSSLCDAWQVSGNERYKEVIEETIAFAERELKSPEGVYYSALDADSEGVEGKFYTWTWDEWLHIAEADDPATTYFGILPEGNWEHTNILHVAKSISEVAAMHKISEEELQKQLLIVKQKVMDARSKRVRPQTDDKSLLSWNALMNIAMAKAATALRNDGFLQRAEAHMDAMLNAFEEGGELMHVWKNGKAKIPANIDDYAYLINALLQLASANGNNELIRKADALTQKCIQNFADEGENFFYYTSKQHTDIPVRKIDLYDGATPSANAVMAQNIFLLSMVMEHNKYAEQALYMLHQMSTTALRYTYSFAFWSMLLQRYAWGPKTIVFTGDNSEIDVKALQQVFLPGVYAIHSGKESPSLPINNGKDFKNETLIFVCTPEACLSPVKEINEAVRLVKGESNV